MPASVTTLRKPRTTAEILAATAEAPLHWWPERDRLALTPVSATSLWGERRWILDNSTHGAAKAQSAIIGTLTCRMAATSLIFDTPISSIGYAA